MEGTDPVNKKLGAALSGGAVLVLALSGCSSSDKGSSAEDKLGPWAKQVCVAMQPQTEKIKAASAAIGNETSQDTPPERVQKADAQAFQDMSDAYKAIGTAVQKAGTPEVEGGATRQKNVVAGLNGVSASFVDLKKQVNALDTKDQTKFAAGLNDLSAQYTKVVGRARDVLNELQAGDVGKAMTQQESCKPAPASATPSAAPSAGQSSPAPSATASKSG
ncbi:small secreted protein [Streptomyces sp. NPDC048664]|uniref:small secreted protein n=1 Tax=Streptomyces sp. NPDC048664 TaxID=3154505 RepID=UPI003431B7F1